MNTPNVLDVDNPIWPHFEFITSEGESLLNICAYDLDSKIATVLPNEDGSLFFYQSMVDKGSLILGRILCNEQGHAIKKDVHIPLRLVFKQPHYGE